MIKLYLKYESSFIKEFRTEGNAVSIGRKSDNELVLDNPTVSGHHCKIYKAGESYFIEDLNSTNGTFVNGKKIIKSGLKDDDVITLVKYSLVFSCEKKMERKENQEKEKTPEETISKYTETQKNSALIEVIENPADSRTEFEINASSTYFGKLNKATIPAKGTNIFSPVPELAAVITVRPDGYYLTPLKEGFPKHNGDPLNEKVLLKTEDTIEVGATKFKFILKKIS